MFACRQKEAILFWDIYGTLQIYFFPSTLLLLVQYKTHLIGKSLSKISIINSLRVSANYYLGPKTLSEPITI
jgi:hypothetical protein